MIQETEQVQKDDTVKSNAAHDERKADYQSQAAKALVDAFSSHPDSVILATAKDGKIHVSVTPFLDLGQLLTVERLIKKYVQEAFERAVIQSAKPESTLVPVPPPALL